MCHSSKRASLFLSVGVTRPGGGSDAAGSDAGSIAGGLYLRPGSWKVLPRIRAAPSIAVFWSQMFLGSAGESLPAWGHSPRCSDVPVDHCCLDSPHPLQLLLFLLDLVLIGDQHTFITTAFCPLCPQLQCLDGPPSPAGQSLSILAGLFSTTLTWSFSVQTGSRSS